MKRLVLLSLVLFACTAQGDVELVGSDEALGAKLRLPRYPAASLPPGDADGHVALVTDGPRGLWLKATAGSWFSVAGQTVNVKELGAKGDGIADDAPAIAAALDSVGSEGGTVFFPPGTYSIKTNQTTNCSPGTAGLCPRSKTRIVGSGASSVLRLDGAGSFFLQVGGQDYVIADLALDANGIGSGARTSFFSAIALAGASNVLVRNVRVLDSSGKPPAVGRMAIVTDGSEHVVVQGNYVSDGLRIKVGGPGNSVLVEGNFVEDANDNAITLAMAGSPLETASYVIRGNVVRRAKGLSVYVGDDGGPEPLGRQVARNVIVDSNVMEGPVPQGSAMIGVKLAQADTARVVVSANTLDNSASAVALFTSGVLFTVQTAPFTQRGHDVVIANNTIRGPFDLGGMRLVALDRASVTGNTVDCLSELSPSPTKTCNTGIHVIDGTDVTISGNAVANVAGSGIYIESSRRANVTGNDVVGAGTAGLFFRAANGETTSANVTGNVVSGAQYGAEEFPFSGGVYDVTYTANDLRGATSSAFYPPSAGRRASANAGAGVGAATWDPPPLAASACASTVIGIAEALAGDAVAVSFSQPLPGGALLGGGVSATGQVAATLCAFGGPLDLAQGTLTASITRR